MSNAKFRADFARIISRTQDQAELVCRKVVADLATGLVMRSPVHTGRFRGNWQFGIVGADLSTNSAPDPSGSGSINRAVRGMEGWKLGQTVYLTNSLPYAQALEYGGSQQAPNGMVRVTVTNYMATLEKIVRSLR